jgi:2-polyprenyl-3-methyl-5-hydroxy-6-metoxy-1,4-benzoquinol methylase
VTVEDRDDPATGRRMLTKSAYADDRNIRSRMAIYGYAEKPMDPAWRTSHVAWDGTQVVADCGCGNGFDLRQLVTLGRCRRIIGIDLSAGMLDAVRHWRESGQVAEPGQVSLAQADVQQSPLRDDSVDVAMAMHMLYHVPDIAQAVRELRRITKPGGTVLASTPGASSLSEIQGLFNEIVAQAVQRPLRSLPALSFTDENGSAILGAEFADVTVHQHDVTLSIPAPEPVVAYMNSLREPTLAYVGEAFDFDAVLEELAARVSDVIRKQGSFRTASRMVVFVCR